MSVTSYAQNFEDVLLWRALRDVEQGNYLDIGAQGPRHDSVSRFFYERGWRGIHVEPTPAYAAALRADRPDEDVIEAAVGITPGLIEIHEFAETGLSTGVPEIAEEHVKNGFPVRSITVPCVSLASLLAKFGNRPLHWLKIDVEGMEQDVLRSWANHPRCPWVVLVEATLPNTQIETHDRWDDELKGRGYQEVWFDGLSRAQSGRGWRPSLAVRRVPRARAQRSS